MSLSNWHTLWSHVRQSISRPATRVPKSTAIWGSQAESLEHRALLSAVMESGVDAGAAEVSVQSSRAAARQQQSYPIVNGSWILTGANGTNVAGTATFVQSSSDQLTATLNIEGLPITTLEMHRKGNRVTLEARPQGGEDTQAKGRFNRNHDEVTFRVVSRLPEGGRAVTNVSIKLNSNTNPTSFTFTLSSTTGANATVVGTKTSILV